MPKSKQDEAFEQALRQSHLRQRIAFNNAYSALLAQQNVQSFQAFTFEDALDNQIEEIEGAGTELRPNQLDRVTRIFQEVTAAAALIQSLPDEAFQDPNAEEDVNTPENQA